MGLDRWGASGHTSIAPPPSFVPPTSAQRVKSTSVHVWCAGGEVFFQRAELWGFSVMVDYWPRRLDLAALKAGNLAEVLNIAPWGNVLLQLPPLRLSGAHGWAALGAALGDHWLKDITTHQARALFQLLNIAERIYPGQERRTFCRLTCLSIITWTQMVSWHDLQEILCLELSLQSADAGVSSASASAPCLARRHRKALCWRHRSWLCGPGRARDPPLTSRQGARVVGG